MADEEQLAILRRGAEQWNAWRDEHPGTVPDFRKADLKGANLKEANLGGADLTRADLGGVDFGEANLQESSLWGASLTWVNLTGADLRGANLREANLREANLTRADLTRADLREANLTGAELLEVNFSNAVIHNTVLASVNLRSVTGLETVHHNGPSTIGTDTLYRSGKLPEAFLCGCGVPDGLIEYLPSLLGALEPIQFYSCFISYSTEDKEFAKRLHGRMQQEHLRVWFAPHDLRVEKLYPQVEEAIRVYDKLLLILSEASIRSNWVKTELRLALKKEHTQQHQVLFPIRLIDYEALKTWKYIDADTGSDIAHEVRSYHIADFTQWKEHDAFEAGFAHLLKSLRAAKRVSPKA